MGNDELDRLSGPGLVRLNRAQDLGQISASAPNASVEAHPDSHMGGYGDQGDHPDLNKRAWRKWTVDDFAVAEGLLTPPVRKAITEIVDEVERLRWELVQSLNRQSFLETTIDQASHLPVLNRRAFTRELDQFLQRSNETKLPSALIYLYLETYEDIRRKISLEAAEGALQHLAIVVGEATRQTDVVGHVGGAGLGIILALAGEEMAVTKSWEVIRKIQAAPYNFEGEPLKLTLSVGIHEIGKDGEWQTAEGALKAADRYQHRKIVNVGGEELSLKQ